MYPKVDAIVFSLDSDSGNLAYVVQENVLFYRHLTLISHQFRSEWKPIILCSGNRGIKKLRYQETNTFKVRLIMINDKVYLRPYQTITMELFRENSYRILAGNYSCKRTRYRCFSCF